MVVDPVEWGQTLAMVKELDHKIRNLRMAVSGLDDELRTLSADLQRLKIQSATALSVLGFLVSALALVFRG